MGSGHDGGTDDPSADETSAPEKTRERIETDPFCAVLGVELVSLGPGVATTRLALCDDHLNFHGTPHGGVVYTLADAAFAAASNAGEATRVALETNVSYLATASVGETLLATAEETHAAGRTAEYRVLIRRVEGETGSGDGSDSDDGDDTIGDDASSDYNGKRIATFRGRAYRV